MQIKFEVKSFQELTVTELYSILKLRFDVFVIEQACIYDELDGYDMGAFHIQMKDEEGALIGYSRFFIPGVRYAEASLGRVVIQKHLRGKGLADELMNETLKQLFAKSGHQKIKIAAQAYLKNFYGKFGFIPITKPYDWDGILHYDMVRE